MSATVATERVFEAFSGDDPGTRAFFHGHSYGGNALCASVALEHLRLMDKWDVLDQAAAGAELVGRMLEREVVPHGAVSDVRRFGLMAGVDLATSRPGTGLGRRVCAATTRRGVLLRPLGDTVVLMPPLTSNAAELRQMVDVLVSALDEVPV
jgi:adenosylmethionine-8-amino-7-oxononanoate aminotransferase